MTRHRVAPGESCPRCRFARLAVENLPGWTDGLIARALTVEASKLYAALHYRAEMDEHRT